jgi:two-component system, sensor histidine kinase
MTDRLVMVVEDDPVVQLLTRHQLARLGQSCIVVSSGEEAVARVKGNISLILMDVGLPGMDGLTATRMIREQEKQENRQSVPIIALTGHSIRDDCLRAGMNDFLQKPALLADIQRVLDTWLPTNGNPSEKQS